MRGRKSAAQWPGFHPSILTQNLPPDAWLRSFTILLYNGSGALRAFWVGFMKRFHCVFALLALCLCLAIPATAELPRPGGSHDLITMNFQDVDISVLAKFISDITGKNFVVDEGVRGKVSIISPTKVTPEQAYSIFKSVLQIKGFTTVNAGPIIRIIPSRDARGAAELTQSQTPAEQAGRRRICHPPDQAAQRRRVGFGQRWCNR